MIEKGYLKISLNRKEKLNELNKLKFGFVWPENEWEKDLGYTERPIWFNSEGIGYFYCDESLGFYKIKSIPKKEWIGLRNKIVNKELTKDELLKFFPVFYDILFLEDNEFDIDEIENLLKLPVHLDEYFYSYRVQEGFDLYFCNTIEEFQRKCNREPEIAWIEMKDDELERWCKRLFTNGRQIDSDWNLD